MIDGLKEKVKDLQPEFLESLKRNLEIPSLKADAKGDFPFGEACEAALQEFLKTAAELGFRTKNVDHYAGWAEMGPEEAPKMVAGICHLDVVPALGWDDAFEPKVVDGKLIGRGSIDDKGPAYSVLYAMKALQDLGLEPKSRIRLIVGIDEESGSACMKYYVKHDEIPDAAFTADADFPVIHAEKGMFTFRLVWENDHSQTLPVIEGHAGTRSNVIPDDAKLTVDGKTYQAKGVMGHASTPELGKNAISLLLEDLNEKFAHPFLKAFHELIGMDYNGERIGLHYEDEVSGKLTLNVGILDANEDEISVTCNVRYPVTQDEDQMLQSLKQAVEAHPVHLELDPLSKPLYYPLDHPLIQSLMAVYRDITGDMTEPLAIGGGTYARAVPNTVAFGASFPGEDGNAHQRDEQVSLETLERACEIYANALWQLSEEAAK